MEFDEEQNGDEDQLHPVWTYFNYDSIHDSSKCLSAGPDCKLKDHSMNGNHIGNLKRHLLRRHKTAYSNLVKEEAEYAAAKEESRQAAKRAKKRSATAMSCDDIKMKLIRLVAVRGRPLKLMDDPEFHDLTSPLTDQLSPEEKFTVNSENVRGMIVTHAENVRKKISKEVKGKLVSLKVDSCTKGKRPFFAINVQFIENKAVQIRTLRVAEMLTSQTAPNLKKEVVSTSSDFSIPSENIYTITADNGGNMKLLVRLLGDEQEEIVEEEVSDLPLPEGTEEVLHGWDETVHEGCAAADYRCQCVRCAAHTLQLAIEAALLDCPLVVATIAEVRKAATNLRTVTGRRQLNRENLPAPTLDNATRWGTKYDMLVSVRKLKEFMENEDLYVGEAKVEDWDAVDNVIMCLEPVKVATTALQTEQLLLGDFLYIWMTCKEKLKKLDHHTLAEKLLERMDEYAKSSIYTSGKYAGQEKSSSLFEYPVILAAIYMDPRYFTYLTEEQRNIAKAHLEKLWVRIQRAKYADEDSEREDLEKTSNQQENIVDSDYSDEDDNPFMKNLKGKNNERVQARASPSANIPLLLDKYFKETKMLKRTSNVLEFWYNRRKSHPELYELSCVALAVPATQVSVERLFSSLSFMLDPLRTKLSSYFVEDLLVIRNNTIFMEKNQGHLRKKKQKKSQGAPSPQILPILAAP